MANSINTNISAYYAQANITAATNNTSLSVARLSSGNRIVRSSDDVAALSAGTSLRTNVTTLRTALINASQGSSLLQVADGALSQITDILQRQKAIAVQAGSGSLDASARSFLDLEFQNLTQEIDRIVSQTNFNGVKLLNGSLSQQAALSNTSKQSTAASATLTLVNNATDADTLVIAGVSLVAKDTVASTLQYQIGSSTSDTVANLAAKLNALAETTTYATTLGQAKYSAIGNTLYITSRTGGTLGENLRINMGGTLVASGDAAIGGEYGGSYLNMFATGFSSATSSVTAATAAVATPFQAGNVIKATIGDGSTLSLHTLTAGDTLQDIVNGINANKSTTGVSAVLLFSSSDQTYNIRLKYNDATQAMAVSGGTNYYNGTDRDYALNGAYRTFSLFDATLEAAVTDNAAVVHTTAAAATPFQAGDVIKVSLAGGSQVTISSALTHGDTLEDIADNINSTAAAINLGIHAAVDAQGDNITLTYNDAQQTRVLGIYGGDNFYNVGTTSNTNGLNNSYTKIQLFSQGFSGGAATQVVHTTAAAATPFVAGNALSINYTPSGGSATGAITIVNAGAMTHGLTLTQLATAINADADSRANGIHAKVITDSMGNANIELSIADSTGSAGNFTAISATGYNDDLHGINLTSESYTSATITSSTDSSTKLNIWGLAGGKDDGIGLASTSVAGTVGDSMITGLSQTRARVLINFPDIADDALTNSTNFKSDGTVYLTVAGHNFSFTTTSASAKAPDEITIGDTLQETLDNAVATINGYFQNGHAVGNVAYQLNQMKVYREDNSIVFEGKNLSTVVDTSNSTTTVNITNFSGGASRTNSGNLDNGSNKSGSTFGIDATGISNADFYGTITGFEAAYKSTNTVDYSVKVGDYTYTATGITTNVTSDTTIRFYSDTLVNGTNGGYFDVQLQANEGQTVANQSDADVLAQRLNAAFSSLTFYQQRNISSYTGADTLVSNGEVIGSLLGSKVAAQLPSFEGAKIGAITVQAPKGSNPDAKITLNIGGVDYVSSAGLSGKLGANQTYRFFSEEDSTYYVDFTTGSSAIDISTSANAQALEDALRNAFGAGNGSAALSFQVGSTSTDKLEVSINNADTDTLYSGASLNVLTQAAAAEAASALDDAINAITAIRANVGALQSRFNFASANIQSSIQNQDAARGTLLDTDIAEESTNYATNQVKLQAGISVLAQANQQLQSLLKLIG